MLSGTAAALAGLAGCSSLTGSPSQETTNSEAGPATTTVARTQASGTATTGGAGNAGDSLLYATDGTTNYGVQMQANPVMGAKDAPVDIYYWSDFQCPFCEKFEQNALPKLTENEVRSGEVRLVFLEFPNIGDASTTAARMSKCVWRQVRESNPAAYKRWHAAVFDAQKKPNSGWASKENLYAITRKVNGVKLDRLRKCLRENRQWASSEIDADVQTARKSGISATPGFVLYNPKSDKAGKIVGAQPYERFQSAIEKVRNA
ncbi:DsbA family protein [Halorussus halophilus]|uniref:DsbA family protein n=1 Tax=Halorussus halophilus TaxID=2650975 RepID=UPI0013019137|nr:thioredoxin domain-containing protein [Halorussus halophilus]